MPIHSWKCAECGKEFGACMEAAGQCEENHYRGRINAFAEAVVDLDLEKFEKFWYTTTGQSASSMFEKNLCKIVEIIKARGKHNSTIAD